MRVERLSTYASDQLQASRRFQQSARNKQSMAEITRMETEANVAAARGSKSLWRKAFRVRSAAERAALADDDAARRQQADTTTAHSHAAVRVLQRSKGEEGEAALVAALSHLTHDWIMFCGYQSKGGEADAVLVGPDGVWVVEVKHRRVRLTVDGPQWYYDQLSSKGRVYERRPAHDGGGRVWGRQASDAAAALGRWLARHHQTVPIRTAVVLTAPGAQIALCRNPGVDLVTTSPAQLEQAMRARATPLTPSSRRTIEDLIQRDHTHTEQVRQSRRRG